MRKAASVVTRRSVQGCGDRQRLKRAAPGVRAGVRRRLQAFPAAGPKELAFRCCAYPMPGPSTVGIDAVVATVILAVRNRRFWPSLASVRAGKASCFQIAAFGVRRNDEGMPSI